MRRRSRRAGTPPGLFEDLEFRRYWWARFVSLAGSSVTMVVLPVIVYERTSSPLWTSLVTVAHGLPYLLLGLSAGVLGDRVDRRRMMIVADLVDAVILAGIPVAYLAGVLTAVHVLLAAAGAGVARVLFDAANFGALPLLVGRRRLVSAQAAVFGTAAVLELAAPAAAGVALTVIAPAMLVAASVLALVASAGLVAGIRRPLWQPRPDVRRTWPELVDGLRFLWRSSVVRLHTAAGTVQAFAAGAFFGQLVPWAQRFGGGPEHGARVGLLFTVWAVGGLIAAVTSTRLIHRYGAARVTLSLLPLSAAGAAAAALATLWWAAVAAVWAWSVAYELIKLTAITARQSVTPDRLQSRVNTTARMITFGVGYPAGALAGGVAASLGGTRVALLAAAGVLGVGAAGGWCSPLRSMTPRGPAQPPPNGLG